MKIVFILCLLVGILGGCASYQGEQVKPAEYYKDGKPVPGNYRMESVFTF
jgi:hypothetical protein